MFVGVEDWRSVHSKHEQSPASIHRVGWEIRLVKHFECCVEWRVRTVSGALIMPVDITGTLKTTRFGWIQSTIRNLRSSNGHCQACSCLCVFMKANFDERLHGRIDLFTFASCNHRIGHRKHGHTRTLRQRTNAHILDWN